MAIRVIPGYKEQLIAAMITELAARKERDELGAQAYESDICDWSETHFYIPNTSKPVKLPLHQKAILRYFFTRDPLTHHFRFQTYQLPSYSLFSFLLLYQQERIYPDNTGMRIQSR